MNPIRQRGPAVETDTSHIQHGTSSDDDESIDEHIFDGSENTSIMLNQYIIGGAVGKGHNGSVRRCWEYAKGKQEPAMAIKIVKRDTLEAQRERQLKQLRRGAAQPAVVDRIHTLEAKIRREIAIMKRCNHPHVVNLYEVIDDRSVNMIYMIMELLDGGEIRWTNNKQQPTLSVDQSRRIIRDTILGLEYLHHHGIIHRDIKPANLVWTTNRERVKIVDFGVAHSSYAQQLAVAASGSTEKNSAVLNDAELARVAGSPPFIAPEVVFDYTEGSANMPRPPITKAIDIWALGVTLYCFLFGRLPFPPPENDLNMFQKELVIYREACNDDWYAPPTMGYERMPTGGRFPVDEESPGGVLMHLLDHCLTKDCRTRITLPEIKRSPWCLEDLGAPNEWLMETSPEPIIPTSTETKAAMSKLSFKWRDIASFFRRQEESTNEAAASRSRLRRKRLNKEKGPAEKEKTHPWVRLFKLSSSKPTSPNTPTPVEEAVAASTATRNHPQHPLNLLHTDLRGGRKSAEALGAYSWPFDRGDRHGSSPALAQHRSSSYHDRHPRELEDLDINMRYEGIDVFQNHDGSWDGGSDPDEPVFRQLGSSDDGSEFGQEEDESVRPVGKPKIHPPMQTQYDSDSEGGYRNDDDAYEDDDYPDDHIDDEEARHYESTSRSRSPSGSRSGSESGMHSCATGHSTWEGSREDFLTFSPSKRRTTAAT